MRKGNKAKKKEKFVSIIVYFTPPRNNNKYNTSSFDQKMDKPSETSDTEKELPVMEQSNQQLNEADCQGNSNSNIGGEVVESLMSGGTEIC